MQLQDAPRHKPKSLLPAFMLREALKEKGFILTPHPDTIDKSTKMDLRLDVSIGGAATSTVDATYETYSVEGNNPDEPLSLLRQLFGNTIVLVAIDSIEPVGPVPGIVTSYICRGCMIYKGRAEEPEPVPDIQTIYLAMKGQFPNIPAYSDLTKEQRTMIINHIGMLVNYIED